jgi:hypothetical protein
MDTTLCVELYCKEFNVREMIKIQFERVDSNLPPPPFGTRARSGVGPPHYRGFTISLRHTTVGSTGSVGLRRTSVQSTHRPLRTQNTILMRDIRNTSGIRTRNPSKQAASRSRLRLCSHWDRLKVNHTIKIIST